MTDVETVMKHTNFLQLSIVWSIDDFIPTKQIPAHILKESTDTAKYTIHVWLMGLLVTLQDGWQAKKVNNSYTQLQMTSVWWKI